MRTTALYGRENAIEQEQERLVVCIKQAPVTAGETGDHVNYGTTSQQ